MLNKDDGTITFILQMAVAPTTDDVESWITERSSRVTFEFDQNRRVTFEIGPFSALFFPPSIYGLHPVSTQFQLRPN